MKVKKLMKELERCNPNADIWIYTEKESDKGPDFWGIVGITDYTGEVSDYLIDTDLATHLF